MARVTPQEVRDLGVGEELSDDEIMAWINIASAKVDLIAQRAPELSDDALKQIELLYAAHLVASRPGGSTFSGIDSVSQESFSVSFSDDFDGGFLDLAMELDPTDTIDPERRNLRYDVKTVDSR